ncbi:MAG TPA: flagellar basal body-associated FliL family protein [Caldimonas sp.]
MSATTADPATPEIALPLKIGKKKFLLIGAVVLALLLVAGAGAGFWLKSRAAHAAVDAADEELASPEQVAKTDPAHPPTFLPLDAFVVNLADRDMDRYAQIGITLEVDSALFADQMKAYMPAIRNSILMILAHKTSRELLERAGKEQLADEIMRETVRPMGIDIPAPEAAAPKTAEVAPENPTAEVPVVKKPVRRGPHNPVRHVHFSNFIIQ